jgi:recombination protein RecR
MMNCKSELLNNLVEKFKSLPGVGEKAAWKMAFHILNLPKDVVADFANVVVQAAQKIKKCEVCGNFTEDDLCYLCVDDTRDKTVVCVVQNMKDLLAFERTNGYCGVYHVLGGLLSPMDDIGPEDIGISKLLKRIKDSEISEVIMATGPTVEGEATAAYVSRLLKPVGIRVTRLAYGLPVGSSLEYTDDITLRAALTGRLDI